MKRELHAYCWGDTGQLEWEYDRGDGVWRKLRDDERETGRLEQRHEELAGPEEDRQEAVSPSQEVREQG